MQCSGLFLEIATMLRKPTSTHDVRLEFEEKISTRFKYDRYVHKKIPFESFKVTSLWKIQNESFSEHYGRI